MRRYPLIETSSLSNKLAFCFTIIIRSLSFVSERRLLASLIRRRVVSSFQYYPALIRSLASIRSISQPLSTDRQQLDGWLYKKADSVFHGYPVIQIHTSNSTYL